MDLVQIKAKELAVGQVMPWAVYTESGNLLLQKNFVIKTQRQLVRLLGHGLMRPGNKVCSGTTALQTQPSKYRTIFEMEELLLGHLESAYHIGLKDKCSPRFVEQIMSLAKIVQELCHSGLESILGAMQLSLNTQYGLIHPLHAGVICEIIAKKMRLPRDQRLSLLAGALTHDMGYYTLQEELSQQTAPITPIQKERIQNHSAASEQLLISLGVTDKIWLDVVRHHHERLDGSGYPDQLQGEQVSIHARIIAVADIYSAMIRPTQYRHGSDALEVLKELFSSRGSKIDLNVAQTFITQLGIYPAGSLVRLANDEVAVVRSQTTNMKEPNIMCVLSKDGHPFTMPLARIVDDGDYRIVGSVLSTHYKWLKASLHHLWPKLMYYPDSDSK